MNDYILIMHDDPADRAAADDRARWGEYISALRQTGLGRRAPSSPALFVSERTASNPPRVS